MGKVRDILEKKGTDVLMVDPTITIYRGLELMLEKNVGGILVTENGKLVGIFTERDYARKVVLRGKSSKETLIREVMTPNPTTVPPDATIEDCMQFMTDRHFRHLPVTEGEKIVGIISIGDVIRFIIEEQRYIIEHLEQYITGR